MPSASGPAAWRRGPPPRLRRLPRQAGDGGRVQKTRMEAGAVWPAGRHVRRRRRRVSLHFRVRGQGRPGRAPDRAMTAAARPLARRAARAARTRASWPGTSGGARSRASAGARAPPPLTLCPWPVAWLPPHAPGSLPARSGHLLMPPGGPASASDLVPLGRFAVPPGAGPRGERLVEVLLTEGPGAGGRALEVRQQLLKRLPRAVQEHRLVVAG